LSRFGYILGIALLSGLLTGPVVAGDVDVLVESRKGIGLIPSAWRGAMVGADTSPVGGLTWAFIDPVLVETAWRERVGGGGPGWVALDAAIDAAVNRGERVVLPLPTRVAPKSEDSWRARVEDTVKRTSARIAHYEISGDETVVADRYLALYESGVWAAYQGYHRASVGGPGVEMSGGLLFALLKRCAERDLPLSFVSWHIQAEAGDEAEVTYGRVEGMLDRVGLKDRPLAVVSRWSTVDAPDASSVTFRVLHDLTKANLEVSIADLSHLPWGGTALQTFGRLGQVEIPVLFDPEGDLDGVATLDGDDVRILLWANKRSRANLSVSGMRWGRTYAYERSVVGVKQTQLVESSDLRAEDPVTISVSVSPGRPVFLTLTPKN